MSEQVADGVGSIPDDSALREAIRRKVEAAGTSFYWAMRVVPRERRNGMYAVYAFCRDVDDIADDLAMPPAAKLAALADWHGEIDALYAGAPRRLVTRALEEPVARYRLRQSDFHAVID
ncbi:MAG TPA: squalene/phytoene synthase family protein, partial [Stellaceae bacterium]|nr:squalene/phytoene synthase family protein [Stellaceae bacterium]